jgi:hypothetical protein
MECLWSHIDDTKIKERVEMKTCEAALSLDSVQVCLIIENDMRCLTPLFDQTVKLFIFSIETAKLTPSVA